MTIVKLCFIIKLKLLEKRINLVEQLVNYISMGNFAVLNFYAILATMVHLSDLFEDITGEEMDVWMGRKHQVTFPMTFPNI